MAGDFEDALRLLHPLRCPAKATPPFSLECWFRFKVKDELARLRVSYEGPSRYSWAVFASNGLPVAVGTENALTYVDDKLRLRAKGARAYEAVFSVFAEKDGLDFSFNYVLVAAEENHKGLRVRMDFSRLADAVRGATVLRYPDGRIRLSGRARRSGSHMAITLRPDAPSVTGFVLGSEPQSRVWIRYGAQAARAARTEVPVAKIIGRWPALNQPVGEEKKSMLVGFGLMFPSIRELLEGKFGMSPDWAVVDGLCEKRRKDFAGLLPVQPAASDLNRALAAIDAGKRAEALALAEPLARAGSAKAAGFLAAHLVRDPKIPVDAVLAWLRKGAEAERTSLQVLLGASLSLGDLNGRSIPKREKEGLFWVRCAATHGTADAFGFLGSLYARGAGVEQDLVEAYSWALLADEAGLQRARTLCELLEKELDEEGRKAGRRRAEAHRRDLGLKPQKQAK